MLKKEEGEARKTGAQSFGLTVEVAQTSKNALCAERRNKQPSNFIPLSPHAQKKKKNCIK